MRLQVQTQVTCLSSDNGSQTHMTEHQTVPDPNTTRGLGGSTYRALPCSEDGLSKPLKQKGTVHSPPDHLAKKKMRFGFFMTMVVMWVMAALGEATLRTLGNAYLITPQHIKTDPNAAYRIQREYADKHGIYGSRLIESLGNGQYLQRHHHRRRMDTSKPIFLYPLL
ncbi:hypothetical protein O3P69_001345 [Scylla paramamosain]|uniref:Uncharacterized protein n=1 Tax=Scylla paramamosain TaxID=85552 RepID=A0AAW0UPW8_SCYPA